MSLSREAFAEQVKEALLHLYDVAYLPQMELASWLVEGRTGSRDERAQTLRRILIRGIERLDAGAHLPFRARERRSYAILAGRYVRSLTTQDVMDELAISERQYWREHKKAVDALVDLLWEDYCQRATQDAASGNSAEMETTARAEAGLLVAHSQPEEVSVGQVVQQVLDTLRGVCATRGVAVQVVIADPPPLAFVDRTILRQVCMNLLMYAFDLSRDAIVALEVEEQPEAVGIQVRTNVHTAEAQRSERNVGLDVVRQLLEGQGSCLTIAVDAEGCWTALATLPPAQRIPILVIDDNRSLINLFQRYLAGSPYRVVGAESGRRAFELLTTLRPALITLDVMMPNQDGWETLQALKARPDLRAIPVVVCSILDEPELAYSLGADGFMRKPVDQTTLLQAIEQYRQAR